jgi:ubiquitin carboxyl-terminal hydrolase 10
MREFSVIDSAVSAEQLSMRLKDAEFDEHGDAFIPEFVYDVIRRVPRFSSMRVSTAIYPLNRSNSVV